MAPGPLGYQWFFNTTNASLTVTGGAFWMAGTACHHATVALDSGCNLANIPVDSRIKDAEGF